MIDWDSAPSQHMVPGLQRYIEYGIPTGSFMMYILKCDLYGAYLAADGINKMLIENWISWTRENLPEESRGSFEKVEKWVNEKRARNTD